MACSEPHLRDSLNNVKKGGLKDGFWVSRLKVGDQNRGQCSGAWLVTDAECPGHWQQEEGRWLRAADNSRDSAATPSGFEPKP